MRVEPSSLGVAAPYIPSAPTHEATAFLIQVIFFLGYTHLLRPARLQPSLIEVLCDGILSVLGKYPCLKRLRKGGSNLSNEGLSIDLDLRLTTLVDKYAIRGAAASRFHSAQIASRASHRRAEPKRKRACALQIRYRLWNGGLSPCRVGHRNLEIPHLHQLESC